MQQLRLLAKMNDEVDAFYQKGWDQDILRGCILPWKESGTNYIPADRSKELMMDRCGTSCNEFSRTQHAGNVRGSKAVSLAYLGIVYLREGRTADALKTVDLAFAEATVTVQLHPS